MGSRNNQYEDRVSELEHKANAGDHIFRDTLTISREHEKWIT